MTGGAGIPHSSQEREKGMLSEHRCRKTGSYGGAGTQKLPLIAFLFSVNKELRSSNEKEERGWDFADL